MLKSNQELIDQFNKEEQRWRRLQWRKLKRRLKRPELGALPRAILDLLDELNEQRRPADCISSNRVAETHKCMDVPLSTHFMTDIVGKLWGLCHTLRHDGIEYGDYIEQLP